MIKYLENSKSIIMKSTILQIIFVFIILSLTISMVTNSSSKTIPPKGITIPNNLHHILLNLNLKIPIEKTPLMASLYNENRDSYIPKVYIVKKYSPYEINSNENQLDSIYEVAVSSQFVNQVLEKDMEWVAIPFSVSIPKMKLKNQTPPRKGISYEINY